MKTKRKVETYYDAVTFCIQFKSVKIQEIVVNTLPMVRILKGQIADRQYCTILKARKTLK